jgi:hypothetical protein
VLIGRVTAAGHDPLDGATVASVADPGQTAVTGSGGRYALFTTATGDQRFTASMTGYAASTQTATTTAGQVTTLNFTLSPASSPVFPG